MIDVGIVGLDSSHPEAFAERLADRPEARVAAVWDDGDVRDDEYVHGFCERYGAERVDDVEAMVDVVDAAMVLAVNWDRHRELAVPFLRADVPTLVDKPLAGTVGDVNAIGEAAGDTPLFGGSAVPFHPEIDSLPVGVADRSLYCAGYDDPFYYGVHLVDTVRLLADADWTAVAPVDGPGTTVEVAFENGAAATLRLDGPADDPSFGVLDVGDETRICSVGTAQSDFDGMYDGFLDGFLAAVAGEREDAPRLVDGARLLLALGAATEHGTRVTPDSPALQSAHADGGAFVADYSPYY